MSAERFYCGRLVVVCVGGVWEVNVVHLKFGGFREESYTLFLVSVDITTVCNFIASVSTKYNHKELKEVTNIFLQQDAVRRALEPPHSSP